MKFKVQTKSQDFMSIISILDTIFGKINLKSKFEQDFLKELFDLLASIRGRFNFCNFERYSKYNELTFRRHFSKFFDWIAFNLALIELALTKPNSACLAILDASFIAKSGKKTFGLDIFWSGCASKAKKGLEISCLALAEIKTGLIWTLDVTQTPFGLAKKGKKLEDYSRIDFYIEQIFDCLAYLKNTHYIVADGYYAKIKMFDAMLSINKQLITKLRSDANMKYLFDRTKNPDAHGNTKYDGKVNWKNLDLKKWIEIGKHPKFEHILIYTQELYAVSFQKKLKIVLLLNTKNGKQNLLCSTNLFQDAQQIVQYYSLRFQIEFLFRDAKQFMGLNHCQARSEQKLDFHFNMSLAALNLFQLQMKSDEQKDKSMNSLIRKAYNTRLLRLICEQVNSKAKLNIFLDFQDPDFQKIINLGQMIYKKSD